jgi:hypothetical protein
VLVAQGRRRRRRHDGRVLLEAESRSKCGQCCLSKSGLLVLGATSAHSVLRSMLALTWAKLVGQRLAPQRLPHHCRHILACQDHVV